VYKRQVFGWLMLIRCGTEYSGLRFKGYAVALFIIVNTGLITGLGFLVKDMEFSEALKAFKFYYSAAALLFSFTTSVILFRSSTVTLRMADRRNMALIIIASSLSQALLLLLMPHSAWMALIFAFLLFAGMTLMPVYLTYMADLGVIREDEVTATPAGMVDFFDRHEISPREAEIIREIFNGLSNQEIADKLFISLQTVKDHTSRIYAKTNVRNRMQLMTLVRNLNTD
jgi:DNA-binding CsgD family transcriptional regulator